MLSSLSSQKIIYYFTATSDSSSEIYLLIALLMFLNAVILTPPSELIGIGIGLAFFLGGLNYPLMILIATSSNFLGTLFWYYAGLIHSNSKKSRLEMPKWKRRLRKIEKLYQHNADFLVFSLRFVPFFRALCSYPAGKVRMKLLNFALCSLPGLFLWMILWSLLGIFLGQLIIKYHLLISLLFGLIAYFAIKFYFKQLSEELI
jgi:membrane protein DedA with SNARE-associated domain